MESKNKALASARKEYREMEAAIVTASREIRRLKREASRLESVRAVNLDYLDSLDERIAGLGGAK
jgi:hypothetical protein